MARFDSARVHRPDRDLVHAVPLDRDERITRIAWREARIERDITPQRMLVCCPGAVPQPAAGIGTPAVGRQRGQADEVERGSLHSPRTGKYVRQVRVTG